MSFFDRDKTRCSLSGKTIVNGDKVVIIPAFECLPEEPEYICYDSVALRDVFERWELKSKVIQRVSNFWITSYRSSRYFRIINLHEDYLIVKSSVEKKIRVMFLQHVLLVDIALQNWENLSLELARNKTGSFSTVPQSSLRWIENANNVDLYYECAGIDFGDHIILSFSEWSDLKRLLSRAKVE